jgi:parallel beta-helix repeat protein
MLETIIVVLSLLSFLSTLLIYASVAETGESTSSCITYDSVENLITITCRHANLADIDNAIDNSNVLRKETASDDEHIWLLNASILVDNDAILYINSTVVSWLKIVADGKTAYLIHVLGGLKIDSTKVTSWNPNTNDYATTEDSDRNGQDVKVGSPRPYIVVEKEATGTTDITNSEIAYLGYEAGYGAGRTGLRFLGGDGSIIRGNNIHNLWFALYTRGVGGMVIENNDIHHNGHYGLDPHTGTHDMIIRNNTVHDNGSIGIICSLDCYNITIENNKVYNNTKMGVMFSRNMFDSIARNNIVSNEDRGIVISESHNNEIHNNTVTDSGSGIDIDSESSQNTIHNNIIVNIPYVSAVKTKDQALKQNSFYFNSVIKSDEPKAKLDEQKPISIASSNITGTGTEELKRVSVGRTINVTETSNLIMDAFYYLFGWK